MIFDSEQRLRQKIRHALAVEYAGGSKVLSKN